MLGFNVIQLYTKGQKKDSAGTFKARLLVFMNIVGEIAYFYENE
jgi:hypothetical protein